MGLASDQGCKGKGKEKRVYAQGIWARSRDASFRGARSLVRRDTSWRLRFSVRELRRKSLV